MELVSSSPGLDFEPPPMIHELVARDLPAPEYVDALQRHARLSRAARHPLLDLLAGGALASRRAAMRTFFREYYHYSRRFTRFLASVMAALEAPEDGAALVSSSAEEAGRLDDQHIIELVAAGLDPADVAAPRPQLFRRFLVAIGPAPEELERTTPHVATAAWIRSFESLCRTDEATAVGALGIATEGIVRDMYQKLLAGIRRSWPDLRARDRAFFELHALVDDDHAAILRTIAIALAAGPAGRHGLAVGVLGSLDARASFHDQMELFLLSTDRPGEERS